MNNIYEAWELRCCFGHGGTRTFKGITPPPVPQILFLQYSKYLRAYKTPIFGYPSITHFNHPKTTAYKLPFKPLHTRYSHFPLAIFIWMFHSPTWLLSKYLYISNYIKYLYTLINNSSPSTQQNPYTPKNITLWNTIYPFLAGGSAGLPQPAYVQDDTITIISFFYNISHILSIFLISNKQLWY